MSKKVKESANSRNNMDKVMRDLSLKREAPITGLILLIVIYTISTFLTIAASRTAGSIRVYENQIPFSAFAGVFASMSNICVICMAVLYRRPGF